MKTYRCPVCKKPLTKGEYEQALGILGEREMHLRHERAELLDRIRELKVKEKAARTLEARLLADGEPERDQVFEVQSRGRSF